MAGKYKVRCLCISHQHGQGRGERNGAMPRLHSLQGTLHPAIPSCAL